MDLFEENNRNLILSLLFPILTGLISPIITYGFNLGILFQIPMYLTIWGLCILVPSVFFHYAKSRTKLESKRFAIYIGFSFIPILISNILTPLLQIELANNLDDVFDINVIRQRAFNVAFQVRLFFYIALPVIAFVLFIFLTGFSMKKVYEISFVKSILIAIPIVFFSVGLSYSVGTLIGLLF
ncbi:MAG: hypothetical protein EU549_03880 [Promethearchaeota archaeon]|nr:MAG: hypothetical protein EU549_03880 [Candidatus Lokiarchaeota archaeon]